MELMIRLGAVLECFEFIQEGVNDLSFTHWNNDRMSDRARCDMQAANFPFNCISMLPPHPLTNIDPYFTTENAHPAITYSRLIFLPSFYSNVSSSRNPPPPPPTKSTYSSSSFRPVWTVFPVVRVETIDPVNWKRGGAVGSSSRGGVDLRRLARAVWLTWWRQGLTWWCRAAHWARGDSDILAHMHMRACDGDSVVGASNACTRGGLCLLNQMQRRYWPLFCVLCVWTQLFVYCCVRRGMWKCTLMCAGTVVWKGGPHGNSLVCVLIYVHMLSVLGPYMLENSDTKWANTLKTMSPLTRPINPSSQLQIFYSTILL